jgi:hypothetical protein
MISPTALTQIMIRFSERGDERALARLAGRDSRAVPAGALLVAEEDGEIRAAVPLEGRGAVADPFYSTAELVRLLELRRSQLRTRRPAVVGRLARR